MLRRAVVLDTLVVLSDHGACVIVTGHAAGAMHRARHNGHNCATHRRDPRREENRGQIEGKEAARHRCGITSATIGSAIHFSTSDSLLVPENRHKSSFRAEG